MPSQWSTVTVVAFAWLAVPSSAMFLRRAHSDGASLFADVENMLLLIEHGADYQTNCGAVSKAVVVQNSGDKNKVYSHMDLICSALKLPVDVDMCQRYRSTLMGHLHKNAAWNLQSLDYSLLCKGMIKVKAEQQKELEEAVVAAKKYNTALKAGSTGTDDADDAAAAPTPLNLKAEELNKDDKTEEKKTLQKGVEKEKEVATVALKAEAKEEKKEEKKEKKEEKVVKKEEKEEKKEEKEEEKADDKKQEEQKEEDEDKTDDKKDEEEDEDEEKDDDKKDEKEDDKKEEEKEDDKKEDDDKAEKKED